MSLASIQNLEVAYGSRVLFQRINCAIGLRDRIGLVGINGSGKSTLLKIIAGLQTPDSGEVRFMRDATVGYLPQDLTEIARGPLLRSVMHSVPGRSELEARIHHVKGLLEGEGSSTAQLELAQQLADLHDQLDHFDEVFGERRADRILRGLGFTDADLTRDAEELSGGWRMRAALAGLLLRDPNLLLLDEPTNHLDLPSLAWFDDFLRRSRSAIVLVSHDRDFINRHANRILALEVEGLRDYPGDYEDYRLRRTQEVEDLNARAARQAEKRAAVEDFAARFGAKASKARQAQSRLKRLEKEERIQTIQERRRISFGFSEVARSGRDVLALKGITKRYGDTILYENTGITLERGQRVALVGRNGLGKTTLLKIAAGEVRPDGGEVSFGSKVTWAYYAQHLAETLDSQKSILDEIHQLVPEQPKNSVRRILGAFLFSGDDVDKRIGVLSGGERARVALAKLLVRPANLLMMDEPTNHLDLESSEALIEAIDSYRGTLLFVSHNRSFLTRLATRVWEIRDRKVVAFPGSFQDYLHHLELEAARANASIADTAPAAAGKPKSSERQRRQRDAELRQRKNQLEGPLKREILRLEGKIEELESELRTVEEQIVAPDFYADYERARPTLELRAKLRDSLEGLYADWETQNTRLQQTIDRATPSESGNSEQ